jgi:uncharacterized membrane protein (UPF0136 family)
MVLTSSVIVLWVYIVLLLAGGLTGYLKAGSKISLVTSAIFAVALALCALNKIPMYPTAPILILLLGLVFGMRFMNGRKFMPSGLMLGLSAIALILLFVLR